MPATFQKPGFLTAHVVNPLMAGVVRLGFAPRGARVLLVRGRSTGEWRSTPVNPLTLDGQRYLVAPRGETQWVRNLRAAGGEGKLRLGRKEEPFRAVEVPDDQKLPILRAYLKEWAFETSKFFGLDNNPADADLTRIAPNHPVFTIVRD